MLVRIVKDWDTPDIFLQTPECARMWDHIEFTDAEVAQCDYLLVLQRPHHSLNVLCPAGNAWLITQEPPVPFFRFQTRSFKYFDKVFSYFDEPGARPLQPLLPWHVHRSYDELVAVGESALAHKADTLTWITSNKTGMPGHRARMEFLAFLHRSDFRFNLFGRGFNPINDKFEGLFPSKYALAIENFSCDHYWTEKLADCFLSWSLPFYWGAPNIGAYFPADSFIAVDIADPKGALETIRTSIANREWEKRLAAIREARDLILNKYQFFPFVTDMIRKDQQSSQQKPLRKYVIPANPFPFTHRAMNHIKYYLSRLAKLLGASSAS